MISRLFCALILLCASITAATTNNRRLRSNQEANRRRLDDTGAQVARVENIQLRVEQAPQELEFSEQELFETIVEGWFQQFYELDVGAGVIGSVPSTTVIFQSQTVNGGTSIITYDQIIVYTSLLDSTAPEAFIVRPFGSLQSNARLSMQLSGIPTWRGRPAGFLAVPVILGVLPTNAPTNAPSNGPTNAPTDPPTGAPSNGPSKAPTGTPTNAPSSPAPTAFPTDTPTAAPTGAPAFGATNSPSTTPVTNAPVTNAPSTAPVTSTEQPSTSKVTDVSVLLENLEIVYNNVDNINDAQLKIIEDSTQAWFNEYYSSTGPNSPESSQQAEEKNVQGNFNFLEKEYSERSLTVILDVVLEYEGQEDRALEILQQPWREPASVGSYRQSLATVLPEFFENVEATEPPKFREATSPSPTPDDGLSQRAIIRIIFIAFAVIILIGVVVIFQMKKRKQPDNLLPKNDTAPYSPHVNEDDDSTLFPEARAKHSEPRRNRVSKVPLPSEKDDESYEGKSVDTNDFDYSKVGANTVAPGSRFSSATPSVASGFSDPHAESDLQTADNEDQFVIYAPAGKLGLVVDNRDDGPPVIHSIKEDSVLIDQIQAGDRLIGVDEVDVRTLSPVRVSKLISKRSTNPLRKLTMTREKAGNDESTAGGQSSFVGSMSRMSGVDTDTQNDALGQGFSSDEETSFVGSMSRVGDDQSFDNSAAGVK